MLKVTTWARVLGRLTDLLELWGQRSDWSCGPHSRRKVEEMLHDGCATFSWPKWILIQTVYLLKWTPKCGVCDFGFCRRPLVDTCGTSQRLHRRLVSQHVSLLRSLCLNQLTLKISVIIMTFQSEVSHSLKYFIQCVLLLRVIPLLVWGHFYSSAEH